MAFLGNHHQWGVAFGILGNIISILVFLAPVPTFYRVYRKKSTEGFQSLPYVVALFSSMLWLYYALLKKDAFLLVTINSFGCVIETIYIIMFIVYAPKDSRNSTIKIVAALNFGASSLILLFTHFLLKGDIRIQVLGWICVAFSVSVFAAPLSILAQVIRTKSVEYMPFNLSFFLTLSAIMWFAYGLLLKDICIALPNILGFLLGFLQMVLYSVYKNASKVIEEKKLPEKLKSVVILTELGHSEVYPVDTLSEIQVDVNEDEKGNELTEESDQKHGKTFLVSGDFQQNENEEHARENGQTARPHGHEKPLEVSSGLDQIECAA